MKVIIVVFLLLLCSIGGASAWYDGFGYRIPITIDNAGNPALEHYQFNISFSQGINETSIRVVNDTDYTIVPHWCENETGGLCYELWFNVSVGSEVNTDYYIYYGNNSIPSTSNYDNTFTKKYNDSGLVLELHIDEGTGNSVTVDSSGEGNDGTLTNMNVTGNATSGWQGVDGGQWDNRSNVIFVGGDHLQFDGVNDYVNCGNDVSLNIVDTLFLSAWCNHTLGATNYLTLVGKYTDANNWLYWRINYVTNDLEVYWVTGGVSSGASLSTIPVPINTWSHCAMFINGTTISFYIDGISVGGGNGAVGLPIVPQTYVGQRGDNGRHFYGSIDEVRIYNRSLSEEEIYRQYIRSKYAANTPTIGIGYTEEIPHPSLSGAYLFYDEMSTGLTGFRNGVGRYLIWGVLFFAVSLAFALIAKIKTTLIGGK